MAEQKKCIVLDLDNTLWGGVVGEDGINGIALSLEEPGASFVSFQQALRDLYDRGILLAISSKNNEADALDAIRTHPNMILKEPHFAAHRINWKEKAENIKELAQELNIGLDSMVFLDDNPVERELVRTALPDVAVPDLPADPREYTRMLHSLPYFASNAVTDEDKMRGNMYVTERLRREAEKKFENKNEFLKSLSLEVRIGRNDESALARLAQMTEKTNQFNTNKIPHSEDTLHSFMQDGLHEVFHAHALDRFGDHGIVALAIVTKEETTWVIETMLMSCRVFERGIEDALLYAIAQAAQAEGAHMLALPVVPSEKNEPARTFAETRFNNGMLDAHDVHKPEWITIT